MDFKLESQYQPTGDQPAAIEKIVGHLAAGAPHQTLLGVTGSGKTFTAANVIARVQKPTLVISHNKTLAAQLYEEFKSFFPENAVHYFVSYYDYYQPEAYLPTTDTYIEKDAKTNEMIDALRHASTASVLTRKDVIIVASVSCIYGIGDPEEYQNVALSLRVDQKLSLTELTKQLVRLLYTRNPLDPRQGHFRMRENTVEMYLPSGEEVISVAIEKQHISSITRRPAKDIHAPKQPLSEIRIFPARHFVTPQDTLKLAVTNITKELSERLAVFKTQDKVLEAARLKQRTEFDMEMLLSTGIVNGIENYSRQLSFREPGSPPHTLIDYFRHAYGDDFLTIIDESHVSIPQIRGMYAGDKARKQTLIDYGFRLPSALDNRPLTFEEFYARIPTTIYASATPAPYEIRESTRARVVQQLIRPTAIPDPQIDVRPTEHQIKDVITEVKKRIARGERSLVMALTKRLAEDISEYLKDAGIRAEYLHSEIKTLERPETLRKLRAGDYDALVGINLLREGLDLPEVSFIAILDADKEGFLRNETTLLQIIGRAARHPDGMVILYGDTLTGSMKAAMSETQRRRALQQEYNKTHGIEPQRIQKEIRSSMLTHPPDEDPLLPEGSTKEIRRELERQMKRAAKEMDFERAAALRDRIQKLSS